ncbi:MAG: CPBP family intramembrane metalloprotease [Lachnospiraceae bacterium]|nr:CPBP family intramembrane metalloprotease [Lachnospiraceae bacterium]
MLEKEIMEKANNTKREVRKKALQFTAAMIPIAAIGGYFTGKYAYASYTQEMQQMILAQVGSVQALALSSMVQSVMYAVICGFIGYLLAEKTGLMKPIKYERESLLKVVIITLICGILFSLDYWTFGKALPEVAATYESEITIRSFDNWMASIFYGGFIEEVLLRLFFMSLVALLLWKIFCRNYGKEEIPEAVYIAANIISAMLFAAGHLPTTISMFGGLTLLVVFRCFLLNGGLGMVFGWIYHKYGIQYAFIGHMGTHIISKIIWLLFV